MKMANRFKVKWPRWTNPLTFHNVNSKQEGLLFFSIPSPHPIVCHPFYSPVGLPLHDSPTHHFFVLSLLIHLFFGVGWSRKVGTPLE
jgi:hypothetical protein